MHGLYILLFPVLSFVMIGESEKWVDVLATLDQFLLFWAPFCACKIGLN